MIFQAVRYSFIHFKAYILKAERFLTLEQLYFVVNMMPLFLTFVLKFKFLKLNLAFINWINDF